MCQTRRITKQRNELTVDDDVTQWVNDMSLIHCTRRGRCCKTRHSMPASALTSDPALWASTKMRNRSLEAQKERSDTLLSPVSPAENDCVNNCNRHSQ
jgi:hypothetical protein